MPSPQRQIAPPFAHDSRLGDGGDYYHPERYNVRTPEIALAAQFLLATETEAPEVRESLRFEVFPLLPRTDACFLPFRNDQGLYDLYVDDWTPPRPPEDEKQLSLFELDPMSPVILALRDWARRFRLNSPHLVFVAVEALRDWLLDEEMRDREAPKDRWGLQVEFLAHGWGALPGPYDKEAVRKASEGSVGLFPFCLTLTSRWDARLEAEQEFKVQMRERLESALQQYMTAAKVILEARGYRRVPRKTAGHHLLWLVQYQLQGLTCDAIADRYADSNPQLSSSPAGDAVSKAVRSTAGVLGLELR